MRRNLATVAGALAEMARAGTRLITYPLGVPAEPLRLDPRDRSTPVVLVHGLTDNRSVFRAMQRRLRRNGFTSVCCWNYSPLLRDIPRGAADLGRHLDRIRARTGRGPVHVVGHSLGGLIARYHAQCQGGDDAIETLVTLGTPHRGTLGAHLLPTPLGRQLRPGSSVVRRLAEPAPGCRTAVTAVYSDLDELVLPTAAGRCDHPDLGASNVLVHAVGHACLPVHAAVARAVMDALRAGPNRADGGGAAPGAQPAGRERCRPGGVTTGGMSAALLA